MVKTSVFSQHRSSSLRRSRDRSCGESVSPDGAARVAALLKD